MLPKNGGTFQDLSHVVENLMKERVKMGMGKVIHSTPISPNMEEKMWKDAILGGHTPVQLQETVMYLTGVNFALRGGDEHKTLQSAVTLRLLFMLMTMAKNA